MGMRGERRHLLCLIQGSFVVERVARMSRFESVFLAGHSVAFVRPGAWRRTVRCTRRVDIIQLLDHPSFSTLRGLWNSYSWVVKWNRQSCLGCRSTVCTTFFHALRFCCRKS